MKRGRPRTLWRLWQLVIYIAGAYGYLEFLAKPLTYFATPGRTFTGLFFELLTPYNTIYPNVPLSGYIFILASAIFLVFTIGWMRLLSDYIIHSRSGISILDSRLSYTMQDALMTRTHVERQQRYHANREIHATRFEHISTEPGGYLDIDSFSLQSHLGGEELTDQNEMDRLIVPQGTKSLEIIEPYLRPLPKDFLATYLPNSIVLALRGFFRHVIVERKASIIYCDEFNGRYARAQLTSVRYPVTNVVIKFVFFKETAPGRDDIHCDIIRDNIVDRIDPRVENDGRLIVYTFNVGRLYLETARVSWTNTALDAYKALHSNMQITGAPPP